MQLSDQADLLLATDAITAYELFNKASILEEQAAALIEPIEGNEPTRSILYISAASMALHAKYFKKAQRLVAVGLSGYPKKREEQNLLHLLEQINLESHLDLNNVILEHTDFQFSIFGDFIGSGFAPLNLFKDRIDSLSSILRRTYERLCGQKYSGGRPSKIISNFQTFLSIPRESSFAITIKLSRPHRTQFPLFDKTTAAEVIHNTLNCFDHLNNNETEQLSALIGDDTYCRHFLSMAKTVAPDGDKVKLVGFTSNQKRVRFKRTNAEVAKIPLPTPSTTCPNYDNKPYTVEGRLDYVHGEEDTIGLATGGKLIRINMQEGLEDFVKQFFGQFVRVTGVKNVHGEIIPQNIDAIDS